GALVGVELHGDAVEMGLVSEPLRVGFLDDLGVQVTFGDDVRATGPLGALGVQPLEVLTEFGGLVDVPSLFLGDVRRVEATTHEIGRASCRERASSPEARVCSK